MANSRVTMEVGSDGVAIVTIHNPPVNALAIPGCFITNSIFLLCFCCFVPSCDFLIMKVLFTPIPRLLVVFF